jgi:DNA-binding transcriptional LysR family regulator
MQVAILAARRDCYGARMQMEQADNLADLHLFVQVIDAGGLAAAAQTLGTTRSLVSRRLMALESRLGARLLNRHTRGLSVTATGEEVYRHAVLMCEAAQAALHAAGAGRSGVLRVGAHGLLRPLLDQLLAAWAAAHPDERLVSRGADADAAAVQGQRADVLLDVGVPTQASGLQAHALGSLRLVVVASPALLDRLKHPTRPELVEDRHWLAFAGAPWNLRGVAARTLQPRLATDHLPALLVAARAGMGLVQVPMYACHDDLRAGHLQTLFEGFEARPLPFHANAPKATPAHPFIAFARNHLGGMGAQGVLGSAV